MRYLATSTFHKPNKSWIPVTLLGGHRSSTAHHAYSWLPYFVRQQKITHTRPPTMCFYDTIRYICGGEQLVLIGECNLPDHCVPHVRGTYHSIYVCDLCGAAWEASALTTKAYNDITTPLLEDNQAGYFDCTSIPGSAPASTPSEDAALSPCEEGPQSPLQEVTRGVYNMEITMPMLEKLPSSPAQNIRGSRKRVDSHATSQSQHQIPTLRQRHTTPTCHQITDRQRRHSW